MKVFFWGWKILIPEKNHSRAPVWDIAGSKILMNFSCSVFGKIVRMVFCAFVPINTEGALCFLVSKPIITHILRLWFLLCEFFMHEGIGCAVISLDGSRLLGMTQLFKHVANGESLLSIVEETRCFCISGRSYSMKAPFTKLEEELSW